MQRTEVNKTINTSAKNVWGVISQFAGVENYVPAIEKSVGKGEGQGMERQCTLGNGACFDETLLKLDHQSMELEYDVHDPSPFPFSKYVSTMKVTPIDNNRCEISWGCTYQVDSGTVEKADKMLSDIFLSGIDGLGQLRYA
jgi:mxaD protein